MPGLKSSLDLARERDVAAAANQLAAGLAPGAAASVDPELLRVVTEYFCSGDRASESDSDDQMITFLHTHLYMQ